MKNNAKTAGLLLSGILLAGCATEPPSPDALTKELQKQAALINGKLPLTEDGVILVRATVNKHQMDLHLYQSSEDQNVDNIIHRYTESLCRQPEVRQKILRGASYRIEWRDSANKRVEQRLTSCNSD